jgi:hypothetical protein
MGFKFTITEDDINNHPNDYELGHFIRDKYHKHLNLKFDKCMTCGLESHYTEDTHIDVRYGYIEGMGQFCFQEKICEK